MKNQKINWPELEGIIGQNFCNLHDRLGDMRELHNLLQEQTNLCGLYPWACGWVQTRICYLETMLDLMQSADSKEMKIEALSKIVHPGTEHRDIFKQIDESRETLIFLIRHAPKLLKITPARRWLADLDNFLISVAVFYKLEPIIDGNGWPYPYLGKYPRVWPEKNHPDSIMLEFEDYNQLI